MRAKFLQPTEEAALTNEADDSAVGQNAFIEVLAPTSLSVGGQLRAAREGKGLSPTDIARMLKLSPRQVEALEADDWSRLPCNTIIRGFVRNYARALDLDAVALMTALDGVTMPSSPELEISAGTSVRVPAERGLARRDYVKVFSGVVVLALALLAYFSFPQDVFQSAMSALRSSLPATSVALKKDSVAEPEVNTPDSAIAVPATKESASAFGLAASSSPAPMSSSADSSLPAAPPVASSAASPATVPAVESPAGAPSSTLKLTFSKPSWVEVRDRSGEIIFAQLSQPGSTREIEGKAPFSLVVGNAAHVTLSYKGRRVDLSKRSKDEVARVTVE